MTDKVDDGCNRTENGSSQNKASSSCKPRRRASQGAERTWATLGHTKRLRGVTQCWCFDTVVVRLRATLKSTAGEPAVLFAIAQGRIWNSLQSTCQIFQIPMQEHSRSECHPSEPFCVPASPRYALPLAMLFAVVCSSMTLGHNKK